MSVSKQTQNLIAYIIGISVVFFGTIFLVSSAIGWQYDFRTGELRETGLIIMNSEPSNARISIDNKDFNNNTPFRYTYVKPGSYGLKYSLTNYRSWSKQVSVAAEKVSFADYAWLIPDTIPNRPRYNDRSIKAAWQSLDRKRFIFYEHAGSETQANNQIRLTTTSDLSRSPVDLYTPPVISPTTTSPSPLQSNALSPSTSQAPVTSLSDLTFSSNGSHILVRQTHADTSFEWLIMPSTPTSNPKIINLSKDYQINPSWIAWGPSGDTDIYYLQSGNLYRTNTNDRKINDLIAQSVWSANWSNDVLISVEGPTNDRGLVARPKDNLTESELIGPVAQSKNYQLSYFKLFDDDYIGYLANDTKVLKIAKDIFTKKDKRLINQAGENITMFTVNRSGRYLVHNQDNRFVGLDFELNQRYRFNAPIENLTRWEWMNDQHLALITGNNLRLIDFDGQNNELITSNLSNSTPILFSDNKSILVFNESGESIKSTSTSALQTSRLKHYFLNPDRVLE